MQIDQQRAAGARSCHSDDRSPALEALRAGCGRRALVVETLTPAISEFVGRSVRHSGMSAAAGVAVRARGVDGDLIVVDARYHRARAGAVNHAC
jgi:hypothetical protein